MSEWKYLKIQDLVDTKKYSCVGGPFGSNLISEDYIDTPGVPVIRGNNFVLGSQYFYDEGFVFVSDKKADSLFQNTAYQGDVVFTQRGTIGNVALIPKNTKFSKYVLSQNLMKLSVDPEKADPRFICYYFLSPRVQETITRNSIGSTIPGFNLTQLRNFPVLLPSLKEQTKIADVLSCLDRKISNLRQQNETLEAIAQTLFKHWFVDFEFPNEDGKPYRSSGGEMVRSELGEIPASWHIEPLKKCLTYLIDNRGKTPTFFDIGIPALSAKFVKGGDLVNRDSFNYVSYELFEQSEKLEVGDIILTSEAPLGETYFIAKETRYYPAQRVFALRANPEVISCSYLNYWFSSTIGQSLLQRRASGSTVQGIKQSELYQCEVIFPAKRIQNLASDAFMKALLKREANSKQIQILTKIRDALLPNLMNGKVRIKS